MSVRTLSSFAGSTLRSALRALRDFLRGATGLWQPPPATRAAARRALEERAHRPRCC